MRDTLLLVIGLYLVLGLFEARFPAHREQTIEGRLRNMIFTAIFLLSGVVLVGWMYAVFPFEIRYLPDYGLPFSIAIVFTYVFLTDLIFYWYHRAEHALRPLWAIHELHHSDAELNATTSMRTYWLERPLQTLVLIVPVNYFLGIDATAAILLPFVATGWLFFTHANWRLNLGFLTPVITGPQLHRIHHSKLPEHQGKNFAQFYPVFDIVFGTYYRPAKDEYPLTGTLELASDASVLETLVRPLKLWTALLKKRLRLF
jgi:sterol desaturase/sphingolipid hydroxylase (fatty acid hydroxylase superfamily)